MQSNLSTALGKNTIEATVTIQRPVEEVFRFYQDFKNLPAFLGDVLAIELTGPATSRWTIVGPFGIQAHWTIKMTEKRENEMICYETIGWSTTRTYWKIYFAPGADAGQTRVRELMKAPGGALVRTAL